MFDALGMRGIWQRGDADAIVRKLENLCSRARHLVDHEFGGPGHPNTQDPWNSVKKIRLGFISDTIVIGFVCKEERHAAFAVMMAARYATEIAQLGLQPPVPWTYRGVVAYGDFAMSDDGNFYAGPAVDEAAAGYEKAHAAITWLAPSASAVVAEADDSHFQGAVQRRRYDVPLKIRHEVSVQHTHVASPFVIGSHPNEAEQTASALLATFDLTIPDVQEKHANTQAFLAEHLKEHAAIWAKQRELIRRL